MSMELNCKKCECNKVVIKQIGKKTGAYCQKCGAWIKWLDSKEIKKIYLKIKEENGGNGKAFRTFTKVRGMTIIKCSNCKCQLYHSDAPEPVGQFNLLNANFCPKCGSELV